MPDLNFSIRINGGAQVPLNSRHLVFTGLELRNMQADSAGLMWTRKTLSDTNPIGYNDTVEIFLEARRIFHGRARPGDVTWQGQPVQILGPWHELEARNYELGLDGGNGPLLGDTITVSPSGQYWDGTAWVSWPSSVTWTYGTTGSYVPGATTGTLDVNWYRTSRFWLFAPVGSGPSMTYKTVAVQLDEILATLGHITNPDVIQVGIMSLGGNASPKVRTVEGLHFGEAMRQTLTVKPDCSIWFDYSASGAPLLNARVASLEAVQTLLVGQGNGQILPGYNLKPTDDMIPAGVIIRWEGDASTTTGLGRPFLVDKYPASIVSYDPRVMIQTVTEDVPRVPGIAQEIYNSLAVRRTVGSVSVVDVDFSLGLRPGSVVAVDGDAMLSGLQNLVQAVRWNPDTGIAACSVGYPEHLSLRDRLDLKGWLRRVFYVPGALVSQIVPPP